MNLENPVLNRELLENLRSKRAFFLQALFLVLLGGIVLVAWPQEVQQVASEETSRQISETFARGELLLLALLAPVLSAPAIAGERERRSLDLLLTSPLSGWSIVTGKLLSAVVYLGLLAFSSLPIYALCFRLGGYGPLDLAATFLILFAAAVTCGGIGLVASAFMGRTRSALSVCYVIILPVVLLLVLIPGLMRSLPAAIVLSGFGIVIGGGLTLLARHRAVRPYDEAPKTADDENRDEQMGLVMDRRRFPDCLLSPRSGEEPLDERRNVIFDKEIRYELFGQGTLLMRLLLQVSLVAALPFFIACLFRGLWIYSSYVLLFVMLLAPSLGAGVFTQERERGTLDLLLTTSLGRRRILRGKLLANLRNIGILTAFLMPFFPLYWAIRLAFPESFDWIDGRSMTFQHDWPTAGAASVAVIAATLVLAVTLTVFLSLISRNTLRSMVASYLVVGTLFVAPLVLYQVLTEYAGYAPAQAHWWALTSPFHVLALFDASHLRLMGVRIESAPALAHTVVYVLFALGLSGVLLLASRTLFDRYCQYRHGRRE